MSNSVQSCVSLVFPLDVEDGWPPVAAESLPFRVTPDGYLAVAPPLFVKDLSVDDIIDVTFEADSHRVLTWRHVARSGRTTIRLLRLRRSGTINGVLAELRTLGCNTVGLEEAGAYAVDVPETVPIERVDAALAHLDADAVAAAFPALRHPE